MGADKLKRLTQESQNVYICLVMYIETRETL